MRPTTFTPEQAIARSRSWSTYPKLLCANHVWRAYLGGSPTQDSGKNPSDNGFSNSIWASAASAWANTPAAYKHAGDKNPPFGALVYYGGSGAGHVVLSLGGGRVRSTDYPSSGRIGETTIDQIGTYVRRPYLGWTNWLGGYVADLTPAAPTVRHYSLLTLEQALQLAGWVGKPYDSREYVLDLQQNAVWRGYLPQSGRDGVYGPQTAAAEKRIWDDEFTPKPDPIPVDPPVEVPVEPDPVDPPDETPPDGEEPGKEDPPADDAGGGDEQGTGEPELPRRWTLAHSIVSGIVAVVMIVAAWIGFEL